MTRKLLALCLVLFLCASSLPTVSAAQALDVFFLTPTNASLKVGDTLTVTIAGKNLTDLYASEIKVTFDSNRLDFIGASSEIKEGFAMTPIREDNTLLLVQALIGSAFGKTGDLPLYTLTFQATQAGSASLSLASVEMVDHLLASHEGMISNNLSVEISSSNNGNNGNISSTSTISGMVNVKAAMDENNRSMVDVQADSTKSCKLERSYC